MIELSHVSKTYKTGVRAVKNLNLTIDDGEFVFVVGRSGSGKSTLMKDVYKRQALLPGKSPYRKVMRRASPFLWQGITLTPIIT